MAEEFIIIRPDGSAHFNFLELDGLAGALEEAAANPDVSVGIRQQQNFNPLDPAVVHIAVPWVANFAATAATTAAINWARKTWKRRRLRLNRRPIVVHICGPRGEVISRVVIDKPDGEPKPYDGPIEPAAGIARAAKWRGGP